MIGVFLAIGDESTQWLLYGAGAVLVFYTVIRPMLRKKKADPLERMPKMGLSHQRTVERQMESLLVELSEMARQVTGQLDTRAAKLDALLQEADEKIAELKRLQGGAGNAPAPPPAAMHAEPQDSYEPRTPYEPPREVAPIRPLQGTDARYREVYSLADEGRSSQEIAQHLGRPRGEVELILALRPR